MLDLPELPHVPTNNRRLIILDVDETIWHLHNPAKEKRMDFFIQLSGGSFSVQEPPEGVEYKGCIFCKRPHLEAFIQQLKDWGLDLAIYSTATLPYIHEMLRLSKIDPDLFEKIWHREHCGRGHDGGFYKSVEWALAEGYPRGNVIVVDDSSNYRGIRKEFDTTPQRYNVLDIRAFYGFPDDQLLSTLRRIEILKELDIIEQRRKEYLELVSWQEQSQAYETRVNKGVSFYLWDEEPPPRKKSKVQALPSSQASACGRFR